MTVLVLNRDRGLGRAVRKEFRSTRFSSTVAAAVKTAASFQPSVMLVDEAFYGKEATDRLRAVCPRAEVVRIGDGQIDQGNTTELRAALVKARGLVTSTFVAVRSVRLH